MEVYWRLPVVVQEAALNLYARRLDRLYYGTGYEEWRNRFKGWQSWSRADAEAWQRQQLQPIVELAATQTSYYRNKWKNLDWKSIRSADDLHILPLLDKQEIRQNEESFIVEGLHPQRLWMQKTSGTTGTSLVVY